MNWPDVLGRIEAGEGAHTEFKRGLGNFCGPARTLCAFANGDGGLLVIGVDDSGSISGVDEDPESVQERIASFLHSGCGRPLTAECDRHLTGNGWVHWVHVSRHHRGYEPFSYDGRFWVRRGRATVAPSPSELQELFNSFGLVFTERQIISSATANEIDMEAFDSFMRAQGKQTDDGPQPETDDDLRNASVCAELDGVLRPTLYGLMVFGRGPQRYPRTLSLFVQCARYAGLDRAAEAISVGEAKGRLEDQVGRAMGWFQSLGRGERYHGLHREDLPLMPEHVLREAVVNAVIHRDYAQTGSPILLEVFSDRIEVTSPGTLPNHMTVAQAVGGGAPRSRNEMMANAMVVRRLMERRGRGWLLMRRGMRELNGTEPELINEVEGSYVRVRFRTRAGTEPGWRTRARNGEHPMSGGSYIHLASPATFRFTNLGPVRDASLQLGRLTVVAGRNNTGKSYIANVLHGFLRTWEDWSGAPKYLLGAPADFPNIAGIAETLATRGRAVIPLDPDAIQHQRRTLLDQAGRGFSEEGIPYALGSTSDGFAESSLSVEVEDSDATWAPRPMGTSFRRTAVSMTHDGARLIVSFKEKRPAKTIEAIELDTAWSYYHFLLRGLLPTSFVLSSDRAGISLFHRELDFMKSEVIEVLHKLGDKASRRSVAPILFLTERSDRHSLSVNDDINFTRHVAELRGEAASLPHARKLATQLRSMVGGYYASARDDIRFISRARGADRGFNIPLSLASSSARGLSALYFYLRHQAALGHLLVIDGPESHLDTRNQVLLARLLAGFVASGLRVLITTHSDYLVKELNNLIMLSRDFRGKIALARKLGYKAREEIDPRLVRAYVAGDGGLTECGIGPFGIEMPVFDETIDSINAAAIELSSRAEGAK